MTPPGVALRGDGAHSPSSPLWMRLVATAAWCAFVWCALDAAHWLGVREGRHMTQRDIIQFVDGYWAAKHDTTEPQVSPGRTPIQTQKDQDQ